MGFLAICFPKIGRGKRVEKRGGLMRVREKTIPPDQRRALMLLAGCSDGCTELMLLAHRVSIETMFERVNARLASVTIKCLARPAIEVTRVQITPAGRAAISGHQGTPADDP